MILVRLVTTVVLASLALLHGGIVLAQGNDNDYTPLNSRIRRDRVFPTENPIRWPENEMSRVARERSNHLGDILSRCLWDRSNERSLNTLAQTDFGFNAFEQIGIPSSEAARRFSFPTCMRRVANNSSTGIILRWSPLTLRGWLLQQAYFDRYPDGPTWLVPGASIAERVLPLSANDVGVIQAMDLADCMVATNPVDADFLFRTARDSADEAGAVARLMPAITECVPEGQQIDFSRADLRAWLGEGLWHASQHSAPVQAETPEESQ